MFPIFFELDIKNSWSDHFLCSFCDEEDGAKWDFQNTYCGPIGSYWDGDAAGGYCINCDFQKSLEIFINSTPTCYCDCNRGYTALNNPGLEQKCQNLLDLECPICQTIGNSYGEILSEDEICVNSGEICRPIRSGACFTAHFAYKSLADEKNYFGSQRGCRWEKSGDMFRKIEKLKAILKNKYKLF